MWVLKFNAKEKWNMYNSRAVKFNVEMQLYSRNYYIENKKVFFINSAIVLGEEENKKKFFDDFKKDKKIEKLEIQGDYFISIYSESYPSRRASLVMTAYNPKLIFIEPSFIDHGGWEHWNIGSFDRKDLEKLLEEVEKLGDLNFELIHFKEKKEIEMKTFSAFPKLTDKQKAVFDLAVSSGYYGYPRKAKLQDLAKKAGISLSTFQFHLAKAEGKLMPFFSKKV
ncbi:MAG: helix-turn-helix domain-containing protein [Nanoarchaeota archaeon]|nr:helix-turn-helix domain-containing protein [Nanoarchaeota archaeon]